MPAYFKPLRRKIGVMTLVLASASATGWVRSLSVKDEITLITGKQNWTTFEVEPNLIFWFRRNSVEIPHVFTRLPFHRIIKPSATRKSNLDSPNIQWKLKWAAFGAGHWTLKGINIGTFARHPTSIYVWYVSYSAIVMPLTLISAYLLLSKPKPRKTNVETLANA